MGTNSGISYLDHVLNFSIGCTKCSPGCDNCWMFNWAKRCGRNPNVVTRTSKATWGQPFVRSRPIASRLVGDLKWKSGDLVGVNFLSDFFHKDFDPWRDEAWEVIKRRPDLKWIICTKRPGRMQGNTPSWAKIAKNIVYMVSICDFAYDWTQEHGMSITTALWNNEYAISFEPLLRKVPVEFFYRTRASWIIIGCESGGNRRPMKHEWAREIIEHCQAQQIPVFLKQVCENPDGSGRLLTKQDDITRAFGNCPREFPSSGWAAWRPTQ